MRIESRAALQELIALLQEVDERWAGPEWNLASEGDVALSHRALMHMLETALVTHFENDPDHPRFQRIVTPTRKLTGDNADAIYFDTPIRAGRRYRIRGNTGGAVYTSFTVELDNQDGRMASRTGGVINDTGFDVASDGSFEVWLGGDAQPRGWMALPEGAARITSRHYFEEEAPAAAGPEGRVTLAIECLDPVGLPAPTTADSVASGIRRVANFVRSRTLEMPPMASAKENPPFVSIVPNQFPKPVPPGDFGLAAADAAYSLAPFVMGPDQALVIRARWPRCRCANVSLWNRFQQTFDYAHRGVSLNRAQTKLAADGSFDVVLASRDPGVPNWLDTEGQPFGVVFWRFMLPEGEIETPQAELVAIDELAG